MSFEIIPAIDLVGGCVVRAEQGDLARKIVYSDDPVGTAKAFAVEGAVRLHVVDLEGAVRGTPVHDEVIRRITQEIDVPVQAGGGIRTIERFRRLRSLGVDRVVIGAHLALAEEALLRAALDVGGERLVVALDSRDREIRGGGWLRGAGVDVVRAAEQLAAAGVARFLCTDIALDGMLLGPNVELLAEVAGASGVPVIASGGVSSVDDLARLASTDGIEGAIVGRAIYDGDVKLTEALERVR